MPNPSNLLYGAIFITSAVLAFSLVPFCKKVAIRFHLIDKPNQMHKTHTEPVPYLGGVSIITPVILVSIFGSYLYADIENLLKLTSLILPSLIIAIVGFIDDSKSLSARFRFLVQISLSVTIAVFFINQGFSSHITNHKFLNFLISVFWIAGLINAFNFIDNLDGGAAGISVIISLSIFVLSFASNQFLIAMLAICLAGATGGFLLWNFNPARIYLGDGGSLFLGSVFSILLLQFEPNAQNPIFSASVPLFIVAIPIIDTTVVVISRMIRGKPIYLGGRDHLAHRIQKLGISKKVTAIILWILSGFFATFGLIINTQEKDFSGIVFVLGFIMMLTLVMFFLRLPEDQT